MFSPAEMLLGVILVSLLQAARGQWGRYDERAFYIHLNGSPVSFEEAEEACEFHQEIIGRLWAPRTVDTHIVTYIKRIFIPDLSKYGPPYAFWVGLRRIHWDRLSVVRLTRDGKWVRVEFDTYAVLYVPEWIHEEHYATKDEDVQWTDIVMGNPVKNSRRMLLRNFNKSAKLKLRYICEFVYDESKRKLPNKGVADGGLPNWPLPGWTPPGGGKDDKNDNGGNGDAKDNESFKDKTQDEVTIERQKFSSHAGASSISATTTTDTSTTYVISTNATTTNSTTTITTTTQDSPYVLLNEGNNKSHPTKIQQELVCEKSCSDVVLIINLIALSIALVPSVMVIGYSLCARSRTDTKIAIESLNMEQRGRPWREDIRRGSIYQEALPPLSRRRRL